MRVPRSRVAVGGLPASVARAKSALESGDDDAPARLDRVLGYDATAVCERLLAPSRDKLREALAAIDGVIDGREACEALVARGLLEPRWLDGQRDVVSANGALDAPASPLAFAELAADAATITAVESLAFECRNLARIRGSDTIRWRVGSAQIARRASERRPGDEGRSARCKAGTIDASHQLLTLLSGRTDFERRDDEREDRDDFRAHHERWISAFEEDVRRYWSWSLAGRNAAMNPYAPLCAAWLSGYVIEAIEPALVLFAPARARFTTVGSRSAR